MEILEEIRALANWPESGHLVISLYLDTKWTDAQQREKVRIFVKDQMNQLEKDLSGRKARWQAVEEDVKFIRTFTEGLVSQQHDAEYDGIALFCCQHEGLRTVIRSRIPFENAIHLAPRPRIRALAHLYDEYETAVFAHVGSRDASLYLVSTGELERHLLISTELPEAHRTGVWSGPRLGRRLEEWTDHHHREVSDQLVRMVERYEVRNLVLSGTDPVVKNFRQMLPKRVDELVIAQLRMEKNPPRKRVLKETVTALRAAERAREEAVMRQVLEQGGGTKVATGVETVLRAILHGRVQRLLISDRFDPLGSRCPTCGWLSAEMKETCDLCTSRTIGTELAEAMVVAVIQRRGEVDEMVGRLELEEMGGVAALLRY